MLLQHTTIFYFIEVYNFVQEVIILNKQHSILYCKLDWSKINLLRSILTLIY